MEIGLNDIPGILVGWYWKIWIQDYLISVIDKLMVNSLSQQIFWTNITKPWLIFRQNLNWLPCNSNVIINDVFIPSSCKQTVGKLHTCWEF